MIVESAIQSQQKATSDPSTTNVSIEPINDEETLEYEPSTALPNVKKYQAVDDVSCIVSDYPDVNVVVNFSSDAKEVKIRDSLTEKIFIMAPGEGKNPSNIMREKDFDAKGFPVKHKSGKYGVHHEGREIPLSKKEYFIARLLYYQRVFSNDSDYLFMCQQYLEHSSLEGQININV